MTKQIPTPNTDRVVADLRLLVNQIKPAARQDAVDHAQRALDKFVAANGSVASAANGTAPDSPERQQLAANRQTIKKAQQTIADPSTSDEDFEKLLAVLTALTAAITANQPKPEPVNYRAIIKETADAVATELMPRLAPPPAPTPAPKPEPEPVNLEQLASTAADRAMERLIPLLATDTDGNVTKAASEASVNALTERVAGAEKKAEAAQNAADKAGKNGKKTRRRVTALEENNQALGLVRNEQGCHDPAPGTFANYVVNAAQRSEANAKAVIWPALVALGITLLIALVVGFITVQGPVYALWIFVLGFAVATGIWILTNRNRFSR
jgi:hypothetical protein